VRLLGEKSLDQAVSGSLFPLDNRRLASQQRFQSTAPMTFLNFLDYRPTQMSYLRMDEILTILEQDARTSIESLSRMTGRSMDDVKKVIADYEKLGVIKNYKTVIDWTKVGSTQVYAFIDVKVAPARDVGFDDVAERIYRFPEVHSVWLVSGDYDLRVVVEGENVQQVGLFVAQKLSTIDRVQATSTHFLLKRYKEDRTIFVDEGEDPRLIVSP
jgi:DNA-binding Lrp family transcriptional regulator